MNRTIHLHSTNPTFLIPFANFIDAHTRTGYSIANHGDSVTFDKHGNMGKDDILFIEFAQKPLAELLKLIDQMPVEKRPTVVVRMHRIEIYNSTTSDKSTPFDCIDLMLYSAEHVKVRFHENNKSKKFPKKEVVQHTASVDLNLFSPIAKISRPTFFESVNICMVGNIVPKKRIYTAIEYMHDIVKHIPKAKLSIIGEYATLPGYGNFEYIHNCLDYVKDLDLGSHIKFFAKTDRQNLSEFLGTQHFILSNSNEEGCHNSVAEGLIAGCKALIHKWRGSEVVYPPDENTFHFNGVNELIKIINNDERVNAVNNGDRYCAVYGTETQSTKLFNHLEEVCITRI